MNSGSYKVWRDEENSKEIHFAPEKNKDKIPESQLELFEKANLMQNHLKSIFADNEAEYMKYSEKLLDLSQAGLVGDTANPDIALIALQQLEEEILNKYGEEYKNDYMLFLGKYCLIGIFFLFIIIQILKANNSYLVNPYLFVSIGSMVGLWFSYGVRKMQVKITDLVNTENDMMKPLVRIIFISITAIFWSMLLKYEVLSFKIGKLDFNTFVSNNEIAILLGFCAGVLETSLSKDVYSKIRKTLE